MRIVTILLFVLCPLLQASEPEAKVAVASPPATAEINPVLELVSGVLTQTRWMSQRGPARAGNPYFRDLKALFDAHQKHRAVGIADALVSRGFTYDAQPSFALSLGPLPDLDLIRPYDPDLLSRFGGKSAPLEELRLALRDLAREAQFEAFLKKHETDYARWCSGTEFDRDGTVALLERFFGNRENEFHLILAPAMFPLGGYGPSFRDKDGRTLVYQVIRADARRDDGPNFPAKRSLEALALHEWGHSFVNPALDAMPERVANLRPHFDAVATLMKAQAYGTLRIYANEQVLRACVVVALRESQQANVDKLIATEEKKGFLLTRAAVNALDEYTKDRKKYPAFADFVPELLDRIAKEPVRSGERR